jgi:hypothetical protein
MKKIYILLLISIISLSSFAQDDVTKGIQCAALISFDQFYLSDKFGGEQIDYRSSELFPETYFKGYQFGFIKRKKRWNQSQLNLTYFPEFKRNYNEMKIGDTDWAPADKTVNLEIYMLDISKIFKINLFMKMLYLNVGVGAGGGAFKWKSDVPEGEFFSFAGQVYPIGGLEFMFLRHFGFFANFRYHYGISEPVSKTVDGLKHQYQFDMEGREFKAGVNIYF